MGRGQHGRQTCFPGDGRTIDTKETHMKNDTPHTLDHFSARMRFPGGRVTKSFGAWLEECERHDSWHELPEEQRKPTLANVAAFLDDYADFEPVQ
jgi:hypothetical protein